MPKISLILTAFCTILALFSVTFSSVLAQNEWLSLVPCKTGDTRPCGSNVGACEPGTRICVNEEWSECNGGIEPIPEVCDDGLDNDCDGLVDECVGSPWIILVLIGVFLFGLMLFLIKMGF